MLWEAADLDERPGLPRQSKGLGSFSIQMDPQDHTMARPNRSAAEAGVNALACVVVAVLDCGEINKSKICKELFPEAEYGLPRARKKREPRFQ